MSNHTCVVSNKSLKNLTTNTIKSTQHHFKTMKAGGHFFCFSNKTTQCQSIDIVRWLSEMSSDSPGGNTLRNLLLNALVSSESKQSSSGVICGQILLDTIQQSLRYQPLSPNEIETIEKDLINISKKSYRSSSDEIFCMIKNLNSDPVSSDIANTAIRMAGSSGTVHLDSESSETTIIKKVSGYNFPATVPEVFISAAKFSYEKSLSKPKVCVIDGIVEKVSEISGIIQKSYEKNQPMIIVARGFNDDVQNTLGVNFETGNLSVVPLVVPYDEFGANLVNDIAVVSGTDLVNSLKGDIISAILWEDIVEVSSATINPSLMKLSITNKKTKDSVRRHRKFLKDKQRNQLYNADVFDRRLSCLMGEGVIITLGRDLGDQWGITKDRISSHLKIFRDASRFGVINLDDVLPVIENRRIKASLKSIKNTSNIVISKALLVGIKVGIDSSKIISQVGGIVYVDK